MNRVVLYYNERNAIAGISAVVYKKKGVLYD